MITHGEWRWWSSLELNPAVFHVTRGKGRHRELFRVSKSFLDLALFNTATQKNECWVRSVGSGSTEILKCASTTTQYTWQGRVSTHAHVAIRISRESNRHARMGVREDFELRFQLNDGKSLASWWIIELVESGSFRFARSAEWASF